MRGLLSLLKHYLMPFEHGFVKVHGSVMQLEKYKNYFLEDIDQLSKNLSEQKHWS